MGTSAARVTSLCGALTHSTRRPSSPVVVVRGVVEEGDGDHQTPGRLSHAGTDTPPYSHTNPARVCLPGTIADPVRYQDDGSSNIPDHHCNHDHYSMTNSAEEEEVRSDVGPSEAVMPALLSCVHWWLCCCGTCGCCGVSDNDDEEEAMGLLARDDSLSRAALSGGGTAPASGRMNKRARGNTGMMIPSRSQVVGLGLTGGADSGGLEKEKEKERETGLPVAGIPLHCGAADPSPGSSTVRTPVSLHLLPDHAARPLSPLRLSPLHSGPPYFDSAGMIMMTMNQAHPSTGTTAAANGSLSRQAVPLPSRRSSMSSTTTNLTNMTAIHTGETNAAWIHRLPSSASPSELYEEANALRAATAFSSVAVLQDFLARYSTSLPIQLSVRRDTSVGSASGFSGAVEPLALQISGPLRCTPHAALLNLMEDVLLEDCDPALPITSIQLADVSLPARFFSPAVEGADSGERGAGTTNGLPSMNPHLLDYLMFSSSHASSCATPPSTLETLAPSCVFSRTNSGLPPMMLMGACGGAASAAAGGVDDTAGDDYPQSTARTSIFLRNVLDSAAPTLRTLSFLRVSITPQDMAFLCSGVMLSEGENTLSSSNLTPPPQLQLRRLLFEQTALSPAHVDALLSALRQRLQRESKRRGGSSFLSFLQVLQLSGAITVDATEKLLRFLEQVWDHVPALRRLHLPHAVLTEARRHPLVRAHPELRVEGLNRVTKIAEAPMP